MPIHLFLTGDTQVGKSTIISHVVAQLGVPVSGFRTITVAGENGESDLFLIPAAGTRDDFTSASHLAHRTPGRIPEVHPDVFHSCGVPLLAFCSGPLILMDELGWMENSSFLFQTAVFSVLDGTIPVLGVVRDRRLPFLNAVRAHPNVEVFVITRENRRKMQNVVLRLMQKRLEI
ncbi:MAG: nucleoside-triphosphatase [Methanocalculaceae archaeon]|jgi:nucleoside-triphosphatase|nr:nucleoside-triphosphatase [Methanocalculaceae archaeon]